MSLINLIARLTQTKLMPHSILRQAISHILCAGPFPSPQALVILAAALPLFLPAQRFFPDQQPLPVSCQKWDYYQRLSRAKAKSQNLIDQLLEKGRKEFSSNEYFYLELALQDLADCQHPLLANRLGSPGSPFRQLLERLTPVDSLLACEARLIPLNRRLDQLEDICRLPLEEYRPETSENRQAEILAYRFRPGQVIAEIGAGNEGFSTSLQHYQEGLTVFVNDIDTIAVLRLAYHFERNPVFSDEKNQFFAILGTDLDAGLGSVKADRIIIRNAFHHFREPESMLRSISESLYSDGILYLYERYT